MARGSGSSLAGEGSLIETIIEFALLVGLTAAISTWAHAAQQRQRLRLALLILLGVIAVPLLIGGVIALLALGLRNAGAWLALALGLALGLPLLRPVRVALAWVTPMSADSAPDLVGLAILAAVAVVSGWSSLTAGPHLESAASPSAAEIVTQSLAEVLIAYFGVGWLLVRGFGSATARLGLRWPTWRDIWIGLALVFVAFGISIVSGLLTHFLQPSLQRQIDEQLKQITQNVSTGWGAVLLGASAGIGEEILFRGAIQPRYGIVFTSIVFASLHTQYGLSLTVLGIFALSLLLGWERRRYGTVTAIVTHGVYDALAVLLGS